MEDSPTFLSVLSQDVLHNILRYLQGSTELVASKSTPLHHAAHLLFENLVISSGRLINVDFGKSNLYIGLDSDYAAAGALLEGCGRVFKRVKIYNIKKNYGHRLVEFAQLFSRYTTPEIEVHFVRIFDMRTMDSFIEHLVSGATKFTSVNISPLHPLPNSTELVLKNAFTSSLKSFTFQGIHLSRLKVFWESVGTTLEEIDLRTYDDNGWYECMNHLKNHCRKLTSIKLDNPLDDPQVGESDFADLLVSYGPQLLRADFYILSSQKECARLARECINVRCDVRIVGNGLNPLPAEVVSLPWLHNRVETIVFELDPDYINDWTLLRDAMKRCPSIRKMIVFHAGHAVSRRPVSHDAIQAVLPTKMHFLDRIMMSFPLESKSLNYIAKVTSTLKFIHLACIFPIPTDSIGILCRSNPGLEVVKICERISIGGEAGNANVDSIKDGLNGTDDEKQETMALLNKLIPAVTPCRSLRRLLFTFPSRKCPSLKNLRDVSATFRCRQTILSISFGNINFYHPVGGQSKLRREINKKNDN